MTASGKNIISVLGVVEPVPVGQAARDYLAHAVNPTLLKGLTELCKQKPKDPVVGFSPSFCSCKQPAP